MITVTAPRADKKQMHRLSLLCRIGLGDVSQPEITTAILRRALLSARTIERCVAVSLGMLPNETNDQRKPWPKSNRS